MTPSTVLDRTGVEFADSSSASFTYPSSSEVEITAPGSRVTTLTLDLNGDLESAEDPITDSEFRLRAFAYDGGHRITGELLNRGDGTTFQQSWHYDSANTLSIHELGFDEFGVALQPTTFSPAGAVGLVTAAETSAIIGEMGLPTDPLPLPQGSVIDGRGNPTLWRLDERGRPLEQIAGDGGETLWKRHDLTNWVEVLRDPRFFRTTYTYFEHSPGLFTGDVQVEELPDGQSRNYLYENKGTTDLTRFRRTLATDERGNKTTYTYYDEPEEGHRGQLREEIDALTRVTTYTYYGSGLPQQGLLETVTDRRGNVTSYAYDSQRRRDSVIEAHGDPGPNEVTRVTTMAFTDAGNVLSETRQQNYSWQTGGATYVTTSYAYDRLNRNIQTIEAHNVAPSGGGVADDEDNTTTLLRDMDQSWADGLWVGHTVRITSGALSGEERLIIASDEHTITVSSEWSVPPDSMEYEIYVNERRVSTVLYDRASNVVMELRPKDYGGAPVLTVHTYDTANRRTQTDEAVGLMEARTRMMFYDGAGNVDFEVDPLSRITDYEYDAVNRRLLTIEDSGVDLINRTTSVMYDTAGNVESSWDALGRITSYQYDPMNRVTTMVEAEGSTDARLTTTLYDEAGNLLSQTRQQNYWWQPGGETFVTTSYGYDALNRVTTMIEAHNVAPNGSGQANANLNTTTVLYDDDQSTYWEAGMWVGHTVRITVGDLAGEERVIIDNDSTSITISGSEPWSEPPDGMHYEIYVKERRVSTTAYDNAGNVLSTTRQLTYAEGNPATFVTTSYGYDALNRVTTMIEALNAVEMRTSTTVYDAASNVRSQTVGIAEGSSHHPIRTDSVYDLLNRRTEVTEAANGTSLEMRTFTTTYDAAGSVVQVINPQNHWTTYLYDAHNRRTAMTVAADPDNPDRQEMLTQYDAADNVETVTDPLGHVTTYTYDNLNRRKTTRQTITDLVDGVTAVEYDLVDTISTYTDSVGNITTYLYDALDRATTETITVTGAGGDETRTRTMVYDAAGNLLSRFDRRDWERRFTYDQLNRATKEQWYDENEVLQRTITTTFDAADRVTKSEDPDATLVYQYDRLNRVTLASNAGTPNIATVTLTYAHDATDNRKTLTATGTGGFTNSYEYDTLNRASTIVQTVGANSKTVTIVYNKLSQYTDLSRSQTGTAFVARTTYSYDGADRLNGMTHRNSTAALTAYAWTYDRQRLLTQTITTTPASTFAYDKAETYSYRNNDELTGADRADADADETYDYDVNGNRNTPGYFTDLDNRLQTSPDHSYLYDEEGNIKQRTGGGETVDYTFDHRNRLSKVVITGGDHPGTVTYTYDGMDRRNGKEVNGVKTRFVYDGEDIALAFTGAMGTTLRNRYLHGPGIDEVFADDQATAAFAITYWLLTDHLGTVRDLTDSSGALVKHIAYDSYGRRQGETATGIQTLYAFTGREYDVETQLQYHRARYYDPQIGRWIGQDPIGFSAGDSNLYRYVLNQPTTALDPSGKQQERREIVGPHVYIISWIQETKESKMFNAISNKAPPDFFQPAKIRRGGVVIEPDTVGAFLGTKENRNFASLQVTYWIEKGNIVNYKVTKNQEAGYTNLPLGQKPTYVKGEAGKDSFEGKANKDGSVELTYKTRFRVAPLENYGQALFNDLKLLPWAWSSITYKIKPDGKSEISFGGSFLPSHSLYIDGERVRSHFMSFPQVGGSAADIIKAFNAAGGDNDGPGTNSFYSKPFVK